MTSNAGYITPNRLASFECYNGMTPRSNPRFSQFNIDLSVGNPQSIDFTPLIEQDKLEFVQSIFIDNSQNPNVFTAVISVSNQRIVIPPNAQAYISVISPNTPTITFSSLGGYTGIVPVALLNFPVANIVLGDASNLGSGNPLITAQATISVTGTPKQLTVNSYIVQTGGYITAGSGNNAAGGTVGGSTVTNVVNGTGNGAILYVGQQLRVPPGTMLSSIYVNGTAGDIFSFIGA